jgi:hypothetical protein
MGRRRRAPKIGRAIRSKFPGELALGGVVLDVVGDLSHIGDADGRMRIDRKIDAGFGQQRVARNRHAGDREGVGRCRRKGEIAATPWNLQRSTLASWCVIVMASAHRT